ncbi:MAG TPA: hypothetical protein VH593_31660, partial [Ktedonobacteraceae bacterium]
DFHAAELPEEDIEISDLNEIDHRQQDDRHKPAIARRFSLRPRFSLRQRRQQATITVCIVLLVVFLLLGSIPSVRDPAMQKLFGSQATPTPALLSGPDLFYFPHLPSWGHFILDGRPLAYTPTSYSEIPVQLPRGIHHLMWQAEPFEEQQCTLVVPPTTSVEAQSCSISPLLSPNAQTKYASQIAFPATLSINSLPPAQRQSLIQAAQRQLDTLQGTTQVTPGELYSYERDGDRNSTATQFMQASQRFLLDTNPSQPEVCQGLRFDISCSIGTQDCHLFCTLPWPEANTSPGSWDVAAIFRPQWQYQYPASNQLHANSSAPEGSPQFVTFHITRMFHQWDVEFHPQGASSFDDPNCISAIGKTALFPGYQDIARAHQRILWQFRSGQNHAWGCLAIGTPQPAPFSGDTDVPPTSILLLERFGVLLAVGDSAHFLWPTLPVADNNAREQASTILNNTVFIS